MVYSNIFKLSSRMIMGTPHGLDRIRKILNKLGNPQDNLKVFHVGGTNGKGSVCTMLSQILYKQFYKKALTFCSPHIYNTRERWLINNKMISEDLLEVYLEMVFALESDYGEFGFFEITVLVMIYCAIDQKVDYLVCEVGIGGLLDPTNVFHNPLATFTTSISYDHVALLGPTLDDIQHNKMDIMRPGVYHYTRIDNLMMHEYANNAGAKLCIVDDLISTNMEGHHQMENAGLVYRSLLDLGFSDEKIRNGLMNIGFFGRLTKIGEGEYRDGAHNIGGFLALSDYMNNQNYKGLIILCNVGHRTEEIAQAIHKLPRIKAIIATNQKLEKELVTIPIYFKPDYCVANPIEAYELATSLKGVDDMLIVCGSFYLLRALSPLIAR